jgi:hypothetical protein
MGAGDRNVCFGTFVVPCLSSWADVAADVVSDDGRFSMDRSLVGGEDS